MANTRGLVGRSNQLFAALLAHLGEVDARGLHRTRACASLYTYCIYELRFSEDAAARRAGAAKLVKRFPLLLGAIANGELHLTGLLMLGPHLTPENVVNVLGRAKFRTKKELTKLVRELHPLPLVPDVIEPLRPDPAPLRRPTWQEFVSSFAPAVRELPPGQRPRDWADNALGSAANAANDERDADDERGAHDGRDANDERGAHDGRDANDERGAHDSRDQGDEGENEMGENGNEAASWEAAASAPHLHAPARVKASEDETSHMAPCTHALARFEPLHPEQQLPVTGPQQYQVQFSTTEEHVQLIERAKALLARQAPGKSLGELHLQAMKLLVAALEKQKFAMTERPRKTPRGAPARQSKAPAPAPTPEIPSGSRKRSRHVPAEVRRAVFQRDGGRCSFVDERGERCRETHGLELHHQQPFGKRGSHTATNLTLHRPAHNALAAELDFGRQHMIERRDPVRHESLASAERAWSRGR